MIPHVIRNNNTLSVFLDGDTYTIDRSHSRFDSMYQAILDNDTEELKKLIKIKESIAEFSKGNIKVVDGVLLYKEKPIHNSLSSRIIEIMREGFNISPLLNFMENLMENPSFRAVNELYGFLDSCSLPITDDGCFLAYKKVRNDYFDIYTGTMSNAVGNTLQMERNLVNENPEQTCSHGLHVCSQSYLEHYSSSDNDRVVVVKVNPKDVVAVPVDYNNAKMRVCEYIVVDEVFNGDKIKDFYVRDEFDEDEFDEDEFDEDEFDEDEFDETNYNCDEIQTDMFEDLLNKFEEEDEDDDEEEDEDFANMQNVNVPEKTVNSKVLSYTNILEILRLIDSGSTIADISRQFNVSSRQIRRIRDGEVHAQVLKDYNTYYKNT
jgi:hypothetical protein